MNNNEQILQKKKNIFNNTFKNTNKLVEDKRQILKLIQMLLLKNKKKMIILKNYPN